MTTDTSRTAHQTLRPITRTRELAVLDGLARYRRDRGLDPTAYELLQFLQGENPTLDLNAVRPRLTELETAGEVRKAEKRPCAITRKRVYTWAVVSPAPHPAPYPEQACDLPPIQSELFR
jgi:Fe2+ or Zn2+ uptake regulation protein